jgi:hypothetical protein
MYFDPSALVAAIITALGGQMIGSFWRSTAVALWAKACVVAVAAAAVYFATESVGAWFAGPTFEEKITGQWLERFTQTPNPEQKYSVAFIEYDGKQDAVSFGGYGYTRDGVRISEWNTSTVAPHPARNMMFFAYDGEIINVAEAVDGIGTIRFHPNLSGGSGQIEFAVGDFREEYSGYERVEYELIRITPSMVKELIGKDELRRSDYGAFVRAYDGSSYAETDRSATQNAD